MPDAPAASPADEHQRARWPHLARGIARDVKSQRDVIVERGAHLGRVHLQQGPVDRASGCDHHVVDRRWQILEEPLQGGSVSSGEGRRPLRPDLFGRLAEPDRIAAGEDDLGTLRPGAPGCLKPAARTAADRHDRLPGQFRFVLDCGRSAAAHGSSRPACVTALPGRGHDATCPAA
jgi:hypothetical protein